MTIGDRGVGMARTQRIEKVPVWTVGDRLRKARSLTGLTARDFAEEIGVSQKTVTNAEGDRHVVRKIVLNAWALRTGVPVEWLERGTIPGRPSGDTVDTGRYPHLMSA